MRIHHLPLVLLVAACTDEATSLGGPSDDVFFTCDVVVESLDPADSASELGLDATVTAFFSDVITADDILLGIEGLTGTTTVAEDGLSAIFTPDTTLEPNFSYVAEVRVCGESTTSTFDTLFLEVDPRDLEGRVFGIPFGKGTWTEPTDWDTIAFLVGIDTPDYLLLEITGSNGFDELTLNAGVTGTDVTEPEQAPCADIANWVMDFSDNPNIDTGSDSTLMFDLPWYGDFLFQNLRVIATLNPDGTALNNVVFEGILDTRALGLEGDDGPYSACDTGFINCFACDDGDLMCTDVLIEAAQGQLLDGFDLDENYDPTDDPTCQG